MKTFFLLLTVVLTALARGAGTPHSVDPRIDAQPDPAAGSIAVAGPVSFAGTWKTFVRCKPVDVTLSQVGDKVTGTYSPGNGKIFDGVVKDNTLSFKWTQDGGIEGIGEFIMDVSGKGFAGTSSQLKPRGYVLAWNTTNPSVTPFAGVWQMRLGGQNEVSLTMQQSGVQVTGQYPGNGKLEGSVSGRVMRFRWQSDRGTGSGRFVMEEKNNSFSGTYNRGSNPDDVESTWSGRRPVNPEGTAGCEQPLGVVQGDPGNKRSEGAPDSTGRISEAEYAKKLAEYEAAQKNAPATFAGVWRTKLGEQILYPELLLQQANNKVVGQLFASRRDLGVIKEGIVDRNTLRFQVWRPIPSYNGRYLPDVLIGVGELVMNPDGKSFKGTIFGAATSGTLIAR